MNPEDVADNLLRREDNLWVARTREAPVSYPEAGSAICLSFEEDSYWFRHRNRCIASVVRRFHRGGTIWDVGGGNGFVSRGLLDAGFDVALVEPSAEGAQNALRRGIPRVVCSTLEDARFHPGSLAAVGLFDVLEHVEDDRGFLRLLRRHLSPGAPGAPGGRLFLTVPALPWLWSSNDSASGHFRRYTGASLRRALAEAGFRVEYLTAFFRPLVIPLFLGRSLPSRLGLRRAVRPEVTRREHGAGRGPLPSVLGKILEREERLVREGRELSLGTSLLAVASVASRGPS
jgi:SAM-dependent methyltransferase